MKNKNTVYTVTPPDLRLNLIGPTVLFLGFDLESSKEYINVYEKIFPDVEITFFVGEDGFRPEQVAWYRAVAGMSGNVIVNVDNITAEEVFLAMQIENDSEAMVFWLSCDRIYPAMISLLNSYHYRVFQSVDEIKNFIVDEHGKS